MRASVNRLGVVAVMYKIAFLEFAMQSIAVSISNFTELRASLSVAICMEIYVDKII